ncbi:MAG: AbgT family transporter, partial [Rikenellaceae bacterium]
MSKKKSLLDRFLTTIERVGNALPTPAFLFALLALLILVISALGGVLGWGGVNPSSGEEVFVKSLLTREGIHRILLTMVTNFTGFAPLGVVFVSVLGVGLAEGSGLIRAAIVALLSRINGRGVTFMVVMTGILSNLASDVGYILVIPIGGAIFHSLGRNPIAGMAAAFAGVSGGFSANLLISSVDVMLAAISTTAANIINPDYVVGALSNYYFMFASTVIISIVGTLVTDKIIEPRLGRYSGEVEVEPLKPLSRVENRALLYATLSVVAWIVVLAYGVIPQDGYLRDIASNSALKSVVFTGFVALLFLVTATAGLIYGFMTKRFSSADDVLESLNSSAASLTSYFVLVFFAAQFVSWFNDSNLGMVLAVNGVELIKSMNLGFIPLVLITVLFSALINLVVGSASAKWLLLAPIIIPMFMMLGYSPELAQCAYRIGDSSTNIITPLLYYFPLIIVYFQRYKA